ncbi:MAG TPA: hypothetical protein VG455_00965, partial [Acidimicrobiales bacterium]|nr:hypothetical protein [Acidimicrobiales bacterium]
MVTASRRRRRRTARWVLLGAVLSLVTLLVSLVSSAGSDGPARRFTEQGYLDRMRPLVERSSAQGADLARVRSQGLRLGREAVLRQLQRVTQDARAVLTEVAAADPPPSLSVARSVLLTTMAVRARAAAAAEDGFAQAYAAVPLATPVEILAAAGEDAVAADRTYAIFLESLPAFEGARSPVLPPSRWVVDPKLWERGELTVFVGVLRASASPTPVHDLTLLLVTIKPPAVGTEGPTPVLPLVRAFQVDVVVANVGNAAERNVPVTATLASVSGPTERVQGSVDL